MEKVERIFRMPDLGEGLAHGEILECNLDTGQQVKADHIALLVETTKASIEVPLPFGGEVVRVHCKVGDAIPVGDPLVTILTNEASDDVDLQFTHLVGQRRAGTSDQQALGLTRRLPQRARASGVVVVPAVRRLARQLAVDLEAVLGTGKGGAITIDDVYEAQKIANKSGGRDDL